MSQFQIRLKTNEPSIIETDILLNGKPLVTNTYFVNKNGDINSFPSITKDEIKQLKKKYKKGRVKLRTITINTQLGKLVFLIEFINRGKKHFTDIRCFSPKFLIN